MSISLMEGDVRSADGTEVTAPVWNRAWRNAWRSGSGRGAPRSPEAASRVLWISASLSLECASGSRILPTEDTGRCRWPTRSQPYQAPHLAPQWRLGSPSQPSAASRRHPGSNNGRACLCISWPGPQQCYREHKSDGLVLSGRLSGNTIALPSTPLAHCHQ